MGRVLSVIGTLALCGILASTGVATADPTARDEAAFLDAVVGQGYPGGAETVRVGYSVCSMLDQRMSTSGIERFVADTFDDPRDSAPYYAALFGQYAAYNLCPRHMDKFGNI